MTPKHFVLFYFLAVQTAGCCARSSEAAEGPPVKRESRLGKILTGEHELRKMRTTRLRDGTLSGSYLLFFGSVSGGQRDKIRTHFSWKLHDGTYAISSLPIEKIRVKIVAKKEAPTIRFRWEGTDLNRNMQQYMNEYVEYALVTCQETDWPIDVELPLSETPE